MSPQRRVDAGDVGKIRQIHMKATGIGDLRNEGDVREGYGIPEAHSACGRQHLLENPEPADNPVPVPGGDRLIVGAELGAETIEDGEIVEGMNVGDDLIGQIAHIRPIGGMLRQKRRGMEEAEESVTAGKKISI